MWRNVPHWSVLYESSEMVFAFSSLPREISFSMRLTHLLFCGLLVALPGFAVPAPAAAGVCNSGLYALLLPLSTYAPALSFCSAKFPVATTSTVEQLSTTTVVSVETSTSTDTVVSTTSTITIVIEKRTAKATTPSTKPTSTTSTKNPLATLLSSLEVAAASVLKTACSCIESPIVAETTQTSVTTTTTTTTTVSVTTSYSYVVGTALPTCPATITGSGSGQCSCTYDVQCNVLAAFSPLGTNYCYVGDVSFEAPDTPITSLAQCVNTCDQYIDCVGASFDSAIPACKFYGPPGGCSVTTASVIGAAYAVRDPSCPCFPPAPCKLGDPSGVQCI